MPGGPRTVGVVLVQRLPEGRLEEELAKVEVPREPAVPVWAWTSLDATELAGELHGWAANPNGSNDGLRGLVVAVREFLPGYEAEFCGWVRAEHIRLRDV